MIVNVQFTKGQQLHIKEAHQRARSGTGILIARRAVGLLITLASTVWIARLLSPRDYGLANMALVTLTFSQLFRDFGLTTAMLRKGHISFAEMSLIFWMNVGLTSAIAILILLASPLIATFFGQPIVASLIQIALIGFVCEGFALQHRALINRELRFKTLALIEIAAIVLGFFVMLGLAIAWRNVWAIVLGTVTQSVVAGVLFFRFSRWTPGKPARNAELGSLLKFGANTSLFSLCAIISNNIASVLIGRVLGASYLGQYNRAQTIYTLPVINLVSPIAQATMPLLTRLRSDYRAYRVAYLKLIRRLCAFLMPTSVILMFASPFLVVMLLGPAWQQAGVILAILAPALFAVGLGYATGDLFVTQDRADELRTLGFVELAIRVPSIGAGVWFGVEAAAAAFSASTIAAVALRTHTAGRGGPVTFIDQLRALAATIPLALGAAAGCTIVLLLRLRTPLSGDVSAVTMISLGYILALVVGLQWRSSRKALTDVAGVFGLPTILARVRRRRASA